MSRRSYMRERDRYWLTILELTFVVEADATGSRLAQPYARPWRVTTRRCHDCRPILRQSTSGRSAQLWRQWLP